MDTQRCWWCVLSVSVTTRGVGHDSMHVVGPSDPDKLCLCARSTRGTVCHVSIWAGAGLWGSYLAVLQRLACAPGSLSLSHCVSIWPVACMLVALLFACAPLLPPLHLRTSLLAPNQAPM
jgi:hypothetical protein